jgi:hypothetical protein
MDSSDKKLFARYLLRRLKEYHHEMLSLRVTGQIAEENGFPFRATLKNARQSPDVQKRTDRFFEGFEELIEQLGEESPQTALLKFLQEWEPSGEPN